MPFIFNIDKTTVTEGDIVELRWDCGAAEKVFLTIDNGYKSTRIETDRNGSKKFRLNRSRGKTILTLEAVTGGKSERKRIGVKVKRLKSTKAESFDNSQFRQARDTFARKPLRERWELLKPAIRTAWQYMPEKKRTAYKILGILLLLMLLAAIAPKLMELILLLLAGYMLYTIFRK